MNRAIMVAMALSVLLAACGGDDTTPIPVEPDGGIGDGAGPLPSDPDQDEPPIGGPYPGLM